MEVRLTQPAQRDFANIIDGLYWDSPSAARKIATGLTARFRALRKFPYLGGVCFEFSGDLRRTTVQRYVIYYRLGNNEVEIVRILHGYRDHGPLLEEDE